jgi:hypothetical protein
MVQGLMVNSYWLMVRVSESSRGLPHAVAIASGGGGLPPSKMTRLLALMGAKVADSGNCVTAPGAAFFCHRINAN